MPESQVIHAVVHQPATFGKRSGLLPLVEAVGARPVFYDPLWERVEKHSWTLGSRLRGWGIGHYGSTWNALVPYLDEWSLARRVHAGPGDLVHFLWGEYASPRRPHWFNARGAKLVGTFHCSARRLPKVLARYRCLESFDRISVMSKSQTSFFVERGFSPDRIDVTLHGVDTLHFSPGDAGRNPATPLRLFIAGYTERDHDFAAAVLRTLQGARVQLDVASGGGHLACYDGLSNVRILPRLDDEAFVDAYRKADLLFIPMLDCTANNTVLESMACGTPVMANDVGGICEYADNGTNLIMPGKNVDEWSSRIRMLAEDRIALIAARPATRAWAEKFSWAKIAPQFHAFYNRALTV